MHGIFISAGNTTLNKINACFCGNNLESNTNQRVVSALKKNSMERRWRGMGLVERGEMGSFWDMGEGRLLLRGDI